MNLALASSNYPLPRNALRLTLVFLTTTLLLSSRLDAAIVFVNAGQTNNVPDGTSWASAFPTLQSAVAGATDGDVLWVAAGTYWGPTALKNGLALYGGFAGNETDIAQRNWTTRHSVLEGGGTNVVVIIGPGITNAIRLDGFVVRHGDGNAIFCDGEATIVNNLISENTGTGIECYTSSPIIASNIIQGNTGFYAGGIYSVTARPKIFNNRIVGNWCQRSFGGVAGGILCYNSKGAQICNNFICGNWAWIADASEGSAGIYLAAESSSPAPITRVVNNTIVWNYSTAYDGAGLTFSVYADNSYPLIANNLVAFCSSGVTGPTNVNFWNNCVFGNGAINFSRFPDPTGTGGNISADPGFAAYPNSPNPRLGAGSPCVNAGDSVFVTVGWPDYEGQARIVGAAVDIGAAEFEPTRPPLVPAVVRVSPAGDDMADGALWSKAKRSVQAAVDQATLGAGEVWVQAGAYNECIELQQFVDIYGGFNGSETERNQRDWKRNVTILDGHQRGRVVYAHQRAGTNVIDGFVVQNGKALSGGGIYCIRSSAVLANNIITHNTAPPDRGFGIGYGGGISLYGSTSLVTNNVVSFNLAVAGGGLSVEGGLCRIDNNRFEGNLAGLFEVTGGSLSRLGGGAIRIDQLDPGSAIMNNFFIGNIASNRLPAAAAWGSGIAVGMQTAKVLVCNNTLLGNRGPEGVGGPGEAGAGISIEGGFVVDTVIGNNLIAYGSSGLALDPSSGTNFGVTFRNNCVFGNGTNFFNTPDFTGTFGNISVDPLLVSSNNFHLSAGSPCINAGVNSVVPIGSLDLDGQPRIVDGQVDIGADEYVPFSVSLRLGTSTPLLRIETQPGRLYTLEKSGDLVNWIPFSTNIATNTWLEVSTPATGGNAFYRASTAAP